MANNEHVIKDSVATVAAVPFVEASLDGDHGITIDAKLSYQDAKGQRAHENVMAVISALRSILCKEAIPKSDVDIKQAHMLLGYIEGWKNPVDVAIGLPCYRKEAEKALVERANLYQGPQTGPNSFTDNPDIWDIARSIGPAKHAKGALGPCLTVSPALPLWPEPPGESSGA